MAKEKVRRVFKMTTVDLTQAAANTGDASRLAELEGRFEQLRTAQKQAVKGAREAAKTQAQAEIDARKFQQEQADFLIFAGELDKTVALEGIWPTPPYKNEQGNIIMETPYSTKDARVATRVMHSKLADEAKSLEDRFGSMFEDEEGSNQEE